MTDEEKVGYAIGIIIAIIFCPMITIWAINTLFGLGITCTFAHWFAVLWISGTFAVRNVLPK